MYFCFLFRTKVVTDKPEIKVDIITILIRMALINVPTINMAHITMASWPNTNMKKITTPVEIAVPVWVWYSVAVV